MAESKELQVQEKKELESKEEQTVPVARYVPNADIYETEDALTVILEMPGVERDNVAVRLEKDVLEVEGTLDFSNYENLEPVYTEYNVGNFIRRFSVPSQIDQDRISANMSDGVLSLVLPKAEEAKPRRIKVN